MLYPIELGVRLLNHTAHRGEHQGSKKTPP